MLVSLKMCKFEHTELSVYFESLNDECAIVREAQDANLLSQESKLTRVYLQLNWCPSKSTPLSYNGYFFNTLQLIQTEMHTNHYESFF